MRSLGTDGLGLDVINCPIGELQQTPLHVAAAEGHSEAVALLLRHGAVPDAADVNGDSALHLAVKQGHIAVVKGLLVGGASLDAGTSSWVPVCTAVVKWARGRWESDLTEASQTKAWSPVGGTNSDDC